MRTRAALSMGLSLLAVTVLADLSPAEAKPGRDSVERLAHERINAMRASHGMRRLRHSPGLARSASRYAAFMLRRGYFGHLSSIRAPHRYRALGEILLMHRGRRGKPRVAVRRWARSPAHRSVMLNPTFRQVGIGKASGRYGGRQVTMWVAHLGRR